VEVEADGEAAEAAEERVVKAAEAKAAAKATTVAAAATAKAKEAERFATRIGCAPGRC
jgi:hypothetical protein